jgi:hypothetical protein
VPEAKTQRVDEDVYRSEYDDDSSIFQQRGQLMLRGGLARRLNGVASGQRESPLRGVNVRCATAVNTVFRPLTRVLAVVLAVVCDLVVRTWGKTDEA